MDLWNTDLLDTHLVLLNPEISKQISPVSVLFVSIRSLKGLQDMSSRHLQDVFKTCLQDMSSRHVFKTSSRHAFKTSSRHVFKTSSRRLQRNKFSSYFLKDVKLLRWRCGEDVFKTSSRPTNVCWVYSFLTSVLNSHFQQSFQPWRNDNNLLDVYCNYYAVKQVIWKSWHRHLGIGIGISIGIGIEKILFLSYNFFFWKLKFLCPIRINTPSCT